MQWIVILFQSVFDKLMSTIECKEYRVRLCRSLEGDWH